MTFAFNQVHFFACGCTASDVSASPTGMQIPVLYEGSIPDDKLNSHFKYYQTSVLCNHA